MDYTKELDIRLESIATIFMDPRVSLHKTRYDDDLVTCLTGIYKSYIKLLESLDDADGFYHIIRQRLPEIISLCESIKLSVVQYYQGHPADAYYILERAMVDFRNWDTFGYEIIGNKPLYLYRMRIKPKDIILNQKNMFHIPFEEREKVGTNRYSIPGVPCLYLSNSIYTCWEELHRPKPNEINVSRFELSNTSKIKIFDLAIRPERVTYLLSDIFDEWPKYDEDKRKDLFVHFARSIIMWPLMAACSLRVSKRKEKFIPEYIIPQLLLQWVQKEKAYDGIRYFSVSLPKYPDRDLDYMNYVFPVKTVKDSGFCDSLSGLFKVTKPLKWTGVDVREPYNGIEDPRGYLRMEFLFLEVDLIKEPAEKIQ